MNKNAVSFTINVFFSFWMMPSVMLKNMVMGDLSTINDDSTIGGSVEFVSEMVSNCCGFINSNFNSNILGDEWLRIVATNEEVR